jgi:hypothetical protein
MPPGQGATPGDDGIGDPITSTASRASKARATKSLHRGDLDPLLSRALSNYGPAGLLQDV